MTAKRKDQQDHPDTPDQGLIRSENLLREADEELRKEQIEAAWKKYGGLLLMACVMIVLGTAIGVFWQHRTTAQNLEQTSAIYDFLSQEDKEARLANSLEGIETPTTSQEWVTLFYAGNDALELQRYEDAARIYAVLRENRMLGGDMRWLADLMDLRVQMQTLEGDALIPVRARLEELANAEDNPWRAMAYMDAAVLAGEVENDYAGALQNLESATQFGQNSSPLMSLVRDLRHYYTVRQYNVVAPAAGNHTQSGTAQPVTEDNE